MGYYVRILTTAESCVPVSALEAKLAHDRRPATLTIEDGSGDDWTQIMLSHGDGEPIAAIKRNPVEDGSLGAEELDEFAEEIEDCHPVSGRDWLLGFFPRVRCIYACQILSGTEQRNGWDIFGSVKTTIWADAPAIIQADNEGFTNEEGYHILWQFDESTTGEWSMGVLDNGAWRHFQMDLGNRAHRRAFLAGKIPDGVKIQ